MDLNRRENFIQAFKEAFGEGREDWDRLRREQRAREQKSENEPKFGKMMSTYPTGVRIAENLGLGKPEAMEARARMGMGLEKGPTRRAGQMLGTLAQDVVEDKGRSFWWLLNAIQATGGVIAEQAIGKAVPSLFKQRTILNDGKAVTIKQPKTAKKLGLIIDENEPTQTTKGVQIKDGNYVKDNYSPGMVTAATILPTGLAINAGAGLLTPLGGAEGYKALFPSEEDPNKTDNVVGEVAMKYLMGRRGNILPWEEFKKVRPDVSKSEYQQYKAHKHGKALDINPLDGDLNLGGIVKATTEGVHGPEVEMLGVTLPVTTGVIPYATGIAGGIAGGRMGVKNKTAAMGALLGGLAGVGTGAAGGSLLETERRRRNAAENEQDRIDRGYM